MIRERRVVIVRSGMTEKAVYLCRLAVSWFGAELQPFPPVEIVIERWISADLIGEAKTTTRSKEISEAFVQCCLVLDVVQAYRADHKIKGLFRHGEIFEPGGDELTSSAFSDGRPRQPCAGERNHFLRTVNQAERSAWKAGSEPQ